MTVCPDYREDREDRIAARGAEYRAGFMTEAQFRAYLFSMRVRGEDVRHKLAEYAPSPRRDAEAERMERSREWLRERLGRSM